MHSFRAANLLRDVPGSAGKRDLLPESEFLEGTYSMSKLERVTHICLISVALVSLGLLLEKRFSPGATAQSGVQQLLGKRLTVSGLDWKSSGRNVVIYISTKCRDCQKSMAFYRQLAAARDRGLLKVTLSVLSIDSPEDVRKVLAREHVEVDGIYRIPRMIGLNVTPLLLFIDAKGMVRSAIPGKLDSSTEQKVLRFVGPMGRP